MLKTRMATLVAATAALVAANLPPADAAPLPVFSGRVVNLDGTPAADVEVFSLIAFEDRVKTDSSGRFTFQVDPYDQEVGLRRQLPGLPGMYTRVSHQIDGAESREFSESRLPEMISSSILIEDADGDPLVGAKFSGAVFWQRDQDYFGVYADINPHRFESFGFGYPDQVTDQSGRLQAALPHISTPWATGMKVEYTDPADGTRYQYDMSEAEWVEGALRLVARDVDAPAAPPVAPTEVVATAGDRTAEISWTESASGAARVDEYRVTASPGGRSVVVPADTLSAEVDGLTNGTAYTFWVSAANDAGESPRSAPSNRVVPSGLPTPPTSVTATSMNGAARVSWTGASPNGSAILGYRVIAQPGGVEARAGAMADTVVVDGLVNGQSYSFTVVATNVNGDSVASTPTRAVIPADEQRPRAPRDFEVSRVKGSKVVLSWAESLSSDPPVDGYTLTVDGSAVFNLGPTANRFVVKRLAPGRHKFRLAAKNSSGSGAAAKVRVKVSRRG